MTSQHQLVVVLEELLVEERHGRVDVLFRDLSDVHLVHVLDVCGPVGEEEETVALVGNEVRVPVVVEIARGNRANEPTAPEYL